MAKFYLNLVRFREFFVEAGQGFCFYATAREQANFFVYFSCARRIIKNLTQFCGVSQARANFLNFGYFGCITRTWRATITDWKFRFLFRWPTIELKAPAWKPDFAFVSHLFASQGCGKSIHSLCFCSSSCSLGFSFSFILHLSTMKNWQSSWKQKKCERPKRKKCQKAREAQSH